MVRALSAQISPLGDEAEALLGVALLITAMEEQQRRRAGTIRGEEIEPCPGRISIYQVESHIAQVFVGSRRRLTQQRAAAPPGCRGKSVAASLACRRL
jgi:hypothetical protein